MPPDSAQRQVRGHLWGWSPGESNPNRGLLCPAALPEYRDKDTCFHPAESCSIPLHPPVVPIDGHDPELLKRLCRCAHVGHPRCPGRRLQRPHAKLWLSRGGRRRCVTEGCRGPDGVLASGLERGRDVSVTDLPGGCGVDEHAFNAEVGRKIRSARRRAELTQGALARLAGLTRGSITTIESGGQTPPLYRLARIAAALRVEPSDLLPRLEEGARVNARGSLG